MSFAQYAFLVPLFPLLAFVVIVLLTNRSKRLSSNIAIGAMILSGILSYLIFFQAIGEGSEHVLAAAHAGEAPWSMLWDWAPVGLTTFQVGTYLDPLSIIMIVMVTTVGLMIFWYSQGYMNIQDAAHTDPLYARFFAYLSLFAAGMLGYVISPNLVQAIVFWEVMGLCSFLLIGFWFGKRTAVYRNGRWVSEGDANSNAAKKAFLTTRIGDVGFLLGIIALGAVAGTTSYSEVFTMATLDRLKETFIGFGTPTFAFGGMEIPAVGIALPALSVISLLLFMGAVGKSAQFPLHVWLPDAMAGPTPVSAMIHAATMVAAGVFLIARMYPVFAAASEASHGVNPLNVVTVIGMFTAIFAATIGIAQNDIKRILAFSTISQLGFMVAAIGSGAWVAGVFHMLTHAFFKALLFLGSGSVIHGMEHLHMSHDSPGHAGSHQEHGSELPHAPDHSGTPAPAIDPNATAPVWAVRGVANPDDPQDIWNMGGLRHKMPITFWTYLMGTLALTGIPLWSGFWSKDEILTHAYETNQLPVWGVLTLTAGITAFYMARQLLLVFFGQPRTAMAREAKESPWTMTMPLVGLAIAATLVGLLGIPDRIGNFFFGSWFHHWIALVPTTGLGAEAVLEAEAPTHLNFLVAGLSVAVAVVGWVVGYLVYGRRQFTATERDPLAGLRFAWNTLQNGYYIDALYRNTFIRGSVALSNGLARFDQRIIDAIVNGVAKLTVAFSALGRWIDTYIVDGFVNGIGIVTEEYGRIMRLIQTGFVQNYLLVVFVSILVLSGIYLALR